MGDPGREPRMASKPWWDELLVSGFTHGWEDCQLYHKGSLVERHPLLAILSFGGVSQALQPHKYQWQLNEIWLWPRA